MGATPSAALSVGPTAAVTIDFPSFPRNLHVYSGFSPPTFCRWGFDDAVHNCLLGLVVNPLEPFRHLAIAAIHQPRAQEYHLM